MKDFYQITAYLLHCQTNLHVGIGSETHGTIDNNVQRDAATGYPTIYATSLKGALREDFEFIKNKNSSEILAIFGNEPKPGAVQQQGNVRFFPALLLSIPVRSNVAPFFNATSVDILQKWKEDMKLFGCLEKTLKEAIDEIITAMNGKMRPQYLNNFGNSVVILEDEKGEQLTIDQEKQKVLKKWLGNSIVIYPTGTGFIELTKNLPTQARNQLEKGESKNLWWEEFVPRETRFYSFTALPNAVKIASLENDLDNQIFQLGANATVGFGYTYFKKIANNQNPTV